MQVELHPKEKKTSLKSTTEIEFEPFGGCCFLMINFIFFFGSIAFIIVQTIFNIVWLLAILIPILLASFICFFGYFTLKPNEAAVLVFYGTYKGTVKKQGYFWVNPLMSVTYMSLRSRNLNGEKIKVNDKQGNPIEIAIVVVECDRYGKGSFRC